VTLLDDLRTKRCTARAAADAILTRSAESGEPLSTEDATAHARAVADATEAADAIEAHLAEQVAELRASAARTPAGTTAGRETILSREQSVHDWAHQRGAFTEDPEQPPLSLDRYLCGLATGDWTGAEHERLMSEGTATAGGHLVPAPLATRFIDLSRNASQVMRAGAVTVPMSSGTLKVPRLTSDGTTPAWKTENAGITPSDLAFDSVTFTARTLPRVVLLSLELFEDSDPSTEGVIAQSFAGQMGQELDRAALLGSGTPPEPRGVLNQTGVTLLGHGANGSVIGSPPAAGTMGWEFLVDGVATVRSFNFEPNAQIMAPRTTQSLAKLRDTTNQYIAPPSYLDGTTRLVTKQVPINVTVGSSADTSYVFTGQWNQCMIGMRTSFTLKFLGERYLADTLSYAYLAYLRADVQLAQPTAFAVDTGVRG
jgi:HK97 family phage major capsid protein